MDLSQIRISPLENKDSLKSFNCAEGEINSWAKKKAYKFNHQNRAKVFIAHLEGNKNALGYYSLTLSTESNDQLSNQNDRDQYPDGFPVLYLGYLGVMHSAQKKGIGKLLLMNCLERAYWVSKHIPFYGVGLRSLNQTTTDIYKKYGFGVAQEEESNPLMILPIWSLIDLFEKHS